MAVDVSGLLLIWNSFLSVPMKKMVQIRNWLFTGKDSFKDDFRQFKKMLSGNLFYREKKGEKMKLCIVIAPCRV